MNSLGETAEWSTLTTGHVAAFCGIGNPTAFRDLLARHGWPLHADQFRVFPDHHRYSRDDVYTLREWSDKLGSPVLLTTQKDLVKLDLPRLNKSPLWAVEIGTEIHSGRELLERCLAEILQLVPADSSQ